MLPVSTLVRRTMLLVPMLDAKAVAGAWRHGADAIVLDLADGVADRDKPPARALVGAAIESVAAGGAEVFVRITRALAHADLKAAVVPGLAGIVLPGPEGAADIEGVHRILLEREREEGIPEGRTEIVAQLDTVKGVWNVREMLHASTRVTATVMDEVGIAADMGIMPVADFDPLPHDRGLVIVETLAATRMPLGLVHPLAAMPRELPDAELFEAGYAARNTGFRGAMFHFPGSVAALNRAFTPTDEQVDYYTRVRVAFAAGIARGTAAVPFDGGRMIDVPVDERARLVLDFRARCDRRDREKASAASRRNPNAGD